MRAAAALLLVALTGSAAGQDTCDNCGRVVSIRQASQTTSAWTPLGRCRRSTTASLRAR
jgi:hypothetical protein